MTGRGSGRAPRPGLLPTVAVASLALALAALVSACGADDTGEEDTAPEPTGESRDADAPDDPGESGSGSVDPAGAGEPVYGGELVFLLEAETNTWDVPSANCAVSCITVLRNVTEPLFVEGDDGEIHPHTASWTSSDDFTEYVVTMREGITFHDGTPADGAALKAHLDAMVEGALHGQVLADLESVEVGPDPLSATLTFSAPFSSLPEVLAERTGYLLAPAFWEGDRTEPIGTGPFVWDEWVRDERTVLVANPDYWRTDAEGRRLPYLDRIVFRPIPDADSRLAGLQAGDADATHDATPDLTETWDGEWVDDGNGVLADATAAETSYLLLNAGAPPFDDPDLRRALALCTDLERYRELRAPGAEIATGPFSPGATGYLADTGYETGDPEAGRALLEEVRAEIGEVPTIVYGTTNDPTNEVTARLFAQMWSEGCGVDVVIDIFDQAELISRAITGDFQVFQWRQHGQLNPANEFVWWHSRHGTGVALNFGRIDDPEVDAALEGMRATDDPDEQRALAEDLNRRFGEIVPNIWLVHNRWRIPYAAGVHGIGTLTLAGADAGAGAGADADADGRAAPLRTGRTWLQEAWIG